MVQYGVAVKSERVAPQLPMVGTYAFDCSFNMAEVSTFTVNRRCAFSNQSTNAVSLAARPAQRSTPLYAWKASCEGPTQNRLMRFHLLLPNPARQTAYSRLAPDVANRSFAMNILSNAGKHATRTVQSRRSNHTPVRHYLTREAP